MTFYCGDCKKECNPIIVNYGIGSYEYWGAPGIDKDECCVSDCCESTVFIDEECTKWYTIKDLVEDWQEDKAARMEERY